MKRVRRAVSLRRYLLLGILLPVGLFVADQRRQPVPPDAGGREHGLRPHAAGLGQVDRRAARRAGLRRRRRAARHRALLGAGSLRGRQPEPHVLPGLQPAAARWCPASPNCRSGAAPCPTAAPMRRWSTSTTTASAASRCAWRCCCSRSPARTAAAWPWSRWPRRWSCGRPLARKILVDTLWRQAVLVAVIALVAVVVVQRATRPVRRLSERTAGPRRRRPDAHRRPRTRRASCCRWWTPPTR